MQHTLILLLTSAIIVHLDAQAVSQLLSAMFVTCHLYYIKATASLNVLKACITLMEHAGTAQIPAKLVVHQQIVALAHL